MRDLRRYMLRSLHDTAFLFFLRTWRSARYVCLAARHAQYHASQNQNQNEVNSTATNTGATGTDVSVPLRWSTADERALEEAVVWARVGLLFVGVKT